MSNIVGEIVFDNNPEKLFHAGQLLSGTVQISPSEPYSSCNIYIQILGKAHTHWTEGAGDNKKSYSGAEEYLSQRTYLFGRQTGSGTSTLWPGFHNYAFQCFLPLQLPASVEGKYGSIKYTARVVLELPMTSANAETILEVPFTVIKSIDLNSYPNLRLPIIVEENATFSKCCMLCCFRSDSLNIVAQIPFGGYYAGQTIDLEIKAQNNSDQSVSEFSATLIKQVTYYEHPNSFEKKIESIPLNQLTTRGCDINKEENIRLMIKIPEVQPLDTSNSNIIKVEYFVRVIGSVGCCHVNPVLDLPIKIGV